MVEATPGGSIKLTIDEYVQHICEKYLDEAVTANSATNRGCAVVMNVKTGEIVGMATKPDFDPNEPFTLYSDTDKKPSTILQRPRPTKGNFGKAHRAFGGSMEKQGHHRYI